MRVGVLTGAGATGGACGGTGCTCEAVLCWSAPVIGAWRGAPAIPAPAIPAPVIGCPAIGWVAIGWAGRSGKTAGLWSLRERRLLGASGVAAERAAAGFGRDLCSHLKPVSRGVGAGGFGAAEGRSEGAGAEGTAAVGADVGAGAFGPAGTLGVMPSFPRGEEGRRS